MAGVGRRYTDEERAAAVALLDTNGGNISATARQLDMPMETLACWAKGTRHPEARANAHSKKAGLAEAFDRIAERALGKLTDEKMDRTGALDLIKVAAIAVDKALLLRGEANQITRSEGSVTARVEHFTAALLQLAGPGEVLPSMEALPGPDGTPGEGDQAR